MISRVFQSNFQLNHIISISGFYALHMFVKLLQTQVWPLNFTNFSNVNFGGFLQFVPNVCHPQRVGSRKKASQASLHCSAKPSVVCRIGGRARIAPTLRPPHRRPKRRILFKNHLHFLKSNTPKQSRGTDSGGLLSDTKYFFLKFLLIGCLF